MIKKQIAALIFGAMLICLTMAGCGAGTVDDNNNNLGDDVGSAVSRAGEDVSDAVSDAGSGLHSMESDVKDENSEPDDDGLFDTDGNDRDDNATATPSRSAR